MYLDYFIERIHKKYIHYFLLMLLSTFDKPIVSNLSDRVFTTLNKHRP